MLAPVDWLVAARRRRQCDPPKAANIVQSPMNLPMRRRPWVPKLVPLRPLCPPTLTLRPLADPATPTAIDMAIENVSREVRISSRGLPRDPDLGLTNRRETSSIL